MNLVFVRDKTDIESYGSNKIDLFFCLTFDAYVYAGAKGLKRTYAFENAALHHFDYYSNGIYLSNMLLDALHHDEKIGQDERLYLNGRLVTFFSMLSFDVELCKSVVEDHKVTSIHCFQERPISIIGSKWTPYTGFNYFLVALRDFSSAKNITLCYYSRRVSSKGGAARSFILHSKLRSWFRENQFFDFKRIYNALTDRRKTICFIGIRGKTVREQFSLDLSKYGYSVAFLPTTDLYIHVRKYFSKLFYDKFGVAKKIGVNAILELNSKKRHDDGLSNEDCNLENIYSSLDLVVRNLDCFSSEIADMVMFLSNHLVEKRWNVQRLRRNKPVAVVGQESMPVLIAANKLNIISFQLPHGGIVTPQLAPMIAKNNITCSTGQSSYYATTGMVTNKCVEIGAPHISFPVVGNKLKNKENFEKNCIVILAKNMGMRRWEFDDYSNYIDICAEVIRVAKENLCKVIIKLHPSGGRHMYDTYSRLDVFMQGHVSISIDDSFVDILSSASIVVAMQESSAIYQAVCANLPVVFPRSHFSAPYLDNSMMEILKTSLYSSINIQDLSIYISDIISSFSHYSDAVSSQEIFKKTICCLSCDDSVGNVSCFIDDALTADHMNVS